MTQVLISHASVDSETARGVGEMIRRSSLDQINAWYSSDPSVQGGLQPGDRWIEVLRENLVKSKAVVTLLTPNSISRPWLYFESGFGAAISDLEVVPVVVGLSMEDIPLPLSMYQVYPLNDYESAVSFLGKLFNRLDVTFDEEMSRVVVKPSISKIVNLNADSSSRASAQAQKSKSIIDVSPLISYLDRRFLDLSSALKGSSVDLKIDFTVPIDLPPEGRTEWLKIDQGMSLQNAIDSIYYMLGDLVSPYSYLERWMVREKGSGVRLVAREIQNRIPAASVFAPGSEWEVVLLETPYVATASGKDIAGRRERHTLKFKKGSLQA